MRHEPALVVHCEASAAQSAKSEFFGSEPGIGGAAILDLQALDDLAPLRAGAVGDEHDTRSLLDFEARGGYEDRGNFVEGAWYSLPLRTLDLSLVENPPSTGGSALFRGTLVANKPVAARKFRIPARAYQTPQTFRRRYRLPNIGDPLELHVVDCGQGNWNEVTTATMRLVYDMGADARWSMERRDAFLRERGLAQEAREIHVMISHWDVDHYHALLSANSADLARVRSFVAPEPVPDTVTCRRALEWLRSHGVSVHLLRPSPPISGVGRRIVLRHTLSCGATTLLRATRGASRNRSGIALHVAGQRRRALLTGDHAHEQVLDAIHRENLPATECVYVTPHHGGNAGRFDPQAWRRMLCAAVLSYGVGNPYGHPLRRVSQALRRLWIPVHETGRDGGGTWTL
jgi:beta-lactamase superfamily II metal-dependent hydrolase